MNFSVFAPVLANAGGGLVAAAVIAVVLLVLIISNIQIVPQARAYVIERLGTYSTTWKTGLHVKIPLIEKVAVRINLMEQVVDFPPQPVITKDNVRKRKAYSRLSGRTRPCLSAYGRYP